MKDLVANMDPSIQKPHGLLKEKDINGALVGGAALKPDSFSEIVKEAIRAYKEK